MGGYFFLGIIVGVLIVWILSSLFTVHVTYGNLRIDRSTGEPLIFLEVSDADLRVIPKHKYITFKVIDEDYMRD